MPTPGPLIEVHDPDDPRLDPYRDLKDPAARVGTDGEQPVFVVEGRLPVERLLQSDYVMHSLLVNDHQVTAVSSLVSLTRERGAPVFVGSREVIAGTVGFAMHRGVVAVANRKPLTSPTQLLADTAKTPMAPGTLRVLAVLEGVNDHENLGALFRNVAAFGVAGVLLDPSCADPLYRRSVRVSVGHVLHTPFARLEPWPGGLREVQDAGFVIAALAPRAAGDMGTPSVGIAGLGEWAVASDHPSGVALLLGAEGAGLSPSALVASDVMTYIPMADGVDSLNVATAAAIAFHTLAGP
jgi:tRNA G18 (ribose-2'-O)-methylase SpoU